LDAVCAAWDGVFRVWPEARVLGKVSGKEGFETAVHPSACILEIGFGGDKEDSTVGFGGLNVVTPWGVENNLPECHAAVWIGRVSNVNVRVEVFVSYTNDWDRCNIIEMFVVVAD